MTLRVMTASIELSGKVLRLCGPAMAHEPRGALHSAPHIQRCGRLAAGSFQSIKLLCTQRVSPTCRILDTIGVGQYGPRGFEGGETLGTSTTRMSTNVRQLAKRGARNTS